jgi:predicted DNA-binding protein
MNPPGKSDQSKETVFIHELSPELEEELMRRAREHGRDPSTEAAEIIERQVEDDSAL